GDDALARYRADHRAGRRSALGFLFMSVDRSEIDDGTGRADGRVSCVAQRGARRVERRLPDQVDDAGHEPGYDRSNLRLDDLRIATHRVSIRTNVPYPSTTLRHKS